jgi:hypothetical protein
MPPRTIELLLTNGSTLAIDFADFASAPEPVPEPEVVPAPDTTTLGGAAPAATSRPYTAWWRVHERHSLSEFKAEGAVLAIAAIIFLFHIVGARRNRVKAKKWARAHASALTNEFALVGFGGAPTVNIEVDADKIIKENSLFEYSTYATGRQNVAFTDVKLTLTKRFNPILNLIESAFGFFMDSYPAPIDTMEAAIYPFDGKETLLVPPAPISSDARPKEGKSTYDNFVWALVNKDRMQKLRDDRYDVSITTTKDHSKLPDWLTIMSENAEITDLLLTSELIDAVVAAGDAFDYLIVTDQPIDKPKTIEETNSRKRLFLKYQLPSDNNYESLLPVFSYFLTIPDKLAQSAHFRPEVTKKLQKTREQLSAQLRKAAEDEKNEERAAEREKARKAKRDAELKGLDAKAQKKYLEKEREKELRKSQKKMTTRA